MAQTTLEGHSSLGFEGPYFRSLGITVTGSFFQSVQKCAAELKVPPGFTVPFNSTSSLPCMTLHKEEMSVDSSNSWTSQTELTLKVKNCTERTTWAWVNTIPISLPPDLCPKSVCKSMSDPTSCAGDLAACSFS